MFSYNGSPQRYKDKSRSKRKRLKKNEKVVDKVKERAHALSSA